MCKINAAYFFSLKIHGPKKPIVMSSVFRPKLADKTNVFLPGKEGAYFLQIAVRAYLHLDEADHASVSNKNSWMRPAKLLQTTVWNKTVSFEFMKSTCWLTAKGPFSGLAVSAAWSGGFSCPLQLAVLHFLEIFESSHSLNFVLIHKKQMWCLCNNSQWMTINIKTQVFCLSWCEAAKSDPPPRADPQRQAVPCIAKESAPRRGLLRKVLYRASIFKYNNKPRLS